MRNERFFFHAGGKRKYTLSIASTPLVRVTEFDSTVIMTEQSQSIYAEIEEQAR